VEESLEILTQNSGDGECERFRVNGFPVFTFLAPICFGLMLPSDPETHTRSTAEAMLGGALTGLWDGLDARLVIRSPEWNAAPLPFFPASTVQTALSQGPFWPAKDVVDWRPRNLRAKKEVEWRRNEAIRIGVSRK